MFSLTNKDKLPLTNNFNRAVNHHSCCGPFFGSGWDLCIKNQSKNNNSYADIGNSYTNEKYPKDQK